jgi:urate oxidase
MLIQSAMLSAVATTAFAQTAPQKTAATEQAEKKICKKTVDTGSFIKGKKVCLTRAQWNRVAEEQSEVARRVVANGTGRPEGN